MNKPILHPYLEYKTPKTGVFSITTDEYQLPGGWIIKEEKHKIIGETDDTYVTRLQEGSHGEWIGDVVKQHNYVLPIGIHKSRFVYWLAK